MNLRPIPVIDLGRAKSNIEGVVGMLVTVPIEFLMIDNRYQRVFQARNEQRCRDLAANWNWSLYTPIIVAGLGDNLFAVIDGQHRAAAALAAGISELPAWSIVADIKQQAKSFLAVNASPTRVDSLQLWHSRHAAGDYDAIMLWDTCTRAGVEIARYPIAASFRNPQVTLCPGVLHDLRLTVGNDLLVRTLKIVVAVGEAQKASLITRNIMRAISRLVGTAWQGLDDEAIAAGLAQVDFGKAIAKANLDASDTGTPIIDCLCASIGQRLVEALSAEDEEPGVKKRA